MVTKDTNSRSVVYQHLFAQICIFCQDTIGYKRYNFLKIVGNKGLFKQKVEKSEISKQYQQHKGRARIFCILLFEISLKKDYT